MGAWRKPPARRRTPRSTRCRPTGWPATATRCAASSQSGSWNRGHGSRRPSVPDRKAFQYTVLRVVPDVERGERVNVGVVLYSPERRFLGARTRVNEQRLRAIAPDLDVAALRRHLDGLVAVAEGDPAGGPIAKLPQSERFGTLSAPSSTIVQPSEVHTGVCEDGGNELDDLFRRLVLS